MSKEVNIDRFCKAVVLAYGRTLASLAREEWIDDETWEGMQKK